MLCPVSLLMLWVSQHYLETSLLVLVLGKCHRPITHPFSKPNPVLNQDLWTVVRSCIYSQNSSVISDSVSIFHITKTRIRELSWNRGILYLKRKTTFVPFLLLLMFFFHLMLERFFSDISPVRHTIPGSTTSVICASAAMKSAHSLWFGVIEIAMAIQL